jgi:hypothetical protein
MRIQTVLFSAASLAFAVVVLGGVVHAQTPTLTPSVPQSGAPVLQPTPQILDVRPIQGASPVHAADSLERSRWSNADEKIDLLFRKGGVVEMNDAAEDELIRGDYSRQGDSVEMTFKKYGRASATINGNKMNVKFIYANGSIYKFDLNKK